LAPRGTGRKGRNDLTHNLMGRNVRNETKTSNEGVKLAKKLADEPVGTVDYLIGGCKKIFDMDFFKDSWKILKSVLRKIDHKFTRSLICC